MDFLILIITMLLGVLGGFFLGKGTAAPVVPKKRTTSPMPSTTPAVANSAGVSGTPAHGLLLVPSNSNIHMVSTQIASSSVLVQRPLMTPSGAHLHSIWSSSSITIAPSSPISAQYRLESAVSTPANAGTPFSDVSPQTEHGLPLLSNVPPPIYSNVHGSSADHSPLTYHAVPAENDTLSAFALSPAAMIASGEAAGSLSDVHHDAQNTGLCEPLKQSALTTILPNGVRRNLIIVSLYLPVTVTRKDGGGWLVQWDQPRSDHMTPNLQMLSETMKVTWVGWPGVFVTKAEEDEISEQLELFNCRPVFMTSDLKEAFFDKCCKGVLWPLLHYRMPTSNPNFAKEWDTVWQSYTTANMLV